MRQFSLGLHRLSALLRRPALMADTLYVVVGQITAKGVVYGATIALAQTLSTQDFATFNYFMISVALLSGYVAAGLPLAITKLVAPGAQMAPGDRHRAVSALLLAAALTSLAAIAGAPLYLPLIISDELPLDGGWIVTATIVSCWAGFAQIALFAVRRFKETLPAIVAGSIAFAAGTVVAAVTADLRPVLIGAIASPLVMVAGMAGSLRRFDVLPAFSRWKSANATMLRTVLIISVPSIGLNVMAGTLNWLVGRALLEDPGSVAEFNMYAVGLQWFALLMLVPTASSLALFPRYVQMSHEGDVPLSALLKPAMLMGGALILLTPIAYVMAPLVTWLYGGTYQFSGLMLSAVVLAAAVAGPQNILGHAVIAFRGAGTWLAANVAALTLCVSYLYLAPPRTAPEAFLVVIATTATLLVLAPLLLAWKRRTPIAGGHGAALPNLD